MFQLQWDACDSTPRTVIPFFRGHEWDSLLHPHTLTSRKLPQPPFCTPRTNSPSNHIFNKKSSTALHQPTSNFFNSFPSLPIDFNASSPTSFHPLIVNSSNCFPECFIRLSSDKLPKTSFRDKSRDSRGGFFHAAKKLDTPSSVNLGRWDRTKDWSAFVWGWRPLERNWSPKRLWFVTLR